MAKQHLAFFLTSTGWGGLEMNSAKLALGLMQKGLPVTIFTTHGSGFGQVCEQDQLPVVILHKRPKKYFDFRSAYRLSKLFKQYHITHAITTDNRDIDVLSLCKRLFMPKLKLVYQQHMELGGNKKGCIHTLRYRMLDQWITPLACLKAQIGERTRYPLSKVAVIPLGIDTRKFSESTLNPADARAQLQLPSDAKILGVIGRIDAKKGQLFVVEALPELRKHVPNLHLLIMGSPTINDPDSKIYFDKIQQFIKTHQLEDIVHIRSASSDVLPFYKAIDVFVLPSERETYGMVTVEAMMCGLPIVATNSGGTPEVLDGYGHLFTPYDQDKFIEHIINTIHDSKQNHHQATAKYDHLVEINRVVETIHNI